MTREPYGIRRLKWTHFPAANEDVVEAWECDHPFGVYFIEHYPDISLPFQRVCLEDKSCISEHATLEGAMQSVWEEHCQNVRACIWEGAA